MPDALRAFSSGAEKSPRLEERIRWLMGELNRLEIFEDGALCRHMGLPEELRIAGRLAWSQRIAQHAAANDEQFFDDLKEASRRRHLSYLKDIKDCLAEAYCVLAKPEGTYCGWPGVEVDFLKRRGGVINTETVKEFALYLWANYRQKEPSSQLELDLEGPTPIISRSRWSQLFQELGLTSEFLPRAHGGRPKAKRGATRKKQGAKPGKNKNFRRVKSSGIKS